MATEGRLEEAAHALELLGVGTQLTIRIGELERTLVQQSREGLIEQLATEGVDAETLAAALFIKKLAGQINVIVHAVGILASLPYILEESEVIESLSLGAGNTGRAHDLETDRRVAEFKFIEWRGGSESIRQNSLFVDIFNLVSTRTIKRRILYVVGKDHPMRFLGNKRAITSVLSRNAAVARRFHEAHGARFDTVREYWESVEDYIEIIDLRDVVPALADRGPDD